jgi:hypothetical protein
MQFFIVRDDLDNETNMKNLMGDRFSSVKGCQLIAKLSRLQKPIFQISCKIIPCSGFWGTGFS